MNCSEQNPPGGRIWPCFHRSPAMLANAGARQSTQAAHRELTSQFIR